MSNRVKMMDMVEDGMVDKNSLIQDMLNWMSEAEVGEFMEKNGYDYEDKDDG